VPFLKLWGDDAGYKVWAALFSTLPILPAFYLLCTRYLSRWYSVTATAFVAVDLWQWEMVVTGALPLVGIGLMFLVLWGLTGIATGIRKRTEWMAVIVGIGLIPYINQTSTGLAAVAVPTYVLGVCLFSHSWQPLRRTLAPLAVGSLLALPAILLFYRDVFPGGDRMTFPGPKLFIPDGWTVGMTLASFASVTACLVWLRSRNVALSALALVMVVHSALTVFSSYDESIINIFFRSQHVVTPLLALTITWLLWSFRKALGWFPALLGISLFVALAVGSQWVFRTQTYYSDMATPDMTAALAMVPDDGTTILTNSFMGGLWLAALSGHTTYWAFSAEPPRMWTDIYTEMRCIYGWRTGCNPLEASAKLNAGWVLVDTRFPHITQQEPNLWGAPEDTWAPTEAAPWLRLTASQGTVRLWEIKNA